MRPTIVIADDHPAARAGLTISIEASGFGRVAAEASNVTELIAAIERVGPCIAVTDLSMDEPGALDGLAMVAAVQRKYPGVKIIVMTMVDSSCLVDALVTFGVAGIISKRDDIAELIEALRQYRQAGTYISKSFQYECVGERLSLASSELTTAEIDVLRQLGNRLSVTAIAKRRSRSVATISRQKKSAMKKLGINNSQQLYSYLCALRGSLNEL